MAFDIQPLDVAGYWHVKYFGEITSEVRHRAFEEAMKLVQGKEYHGILIDFTEARLRMTISDLFELGEKKAGRGLYRKKSAFLHQPEDVENANFLTLVMSNRGLNSHVFTDKSAALKWLIDDSGPLPGPADRPAP